MVEKTRREMARGELATGEATSATPFPRGYFIAATHEERVRTTQHEMARRGFDALVVTDPANIYYLTGYNAWSFYMPQGLLVPAAGPPHLIARAMDASGAHHTATLDLDQIHGYPEHYVHRADTHPWKWIAQRGLELGVLPSGAARIGADLDGHYFSARGYLALVGELSEATVVDSGELVNWIRAIKSPDEQEVMRAAGRICQNAMQVAVEALAEGVRQCDVVALIQSTQTRGGSAEEPEFGGDYPAIVPMLPTGESAGTPHLTWTDYPFRRGEATTIELAGVRHRYHVPLARTVSLGPPSAKLEATAEATGLGLERALKVMQPGATGADVHAAFTAEISRRGLSKESRIGYSIGIAYPPDWGERTVSLRAEESTPLAPGMCLHMILGMWMDGWGYETSEPVLITDSGPELLAPLPQGLVIKP